MIVLAYATPLWRRVMDRKVVAHFDGDISQANLHPRTAARYLKRYPVAASSSQEVAA
jgi:alkane 1-monooxygenase